MSITDRTSAESPHRAKERWRLLRSLQSTNNACNPPPPISVTSVISSRREPQLFRIQLRVFSRNPLDISTLKEPWIRITFTKSSLTESKSATSRSDPLSQVLIPHTSIRRSPKSRMCSICLRSA